MAWSYQVTAFTEPMVNSIDAINQFLASCRARPVG